MPFWGIFPTIFPFILQFSRLYVTLHAKHECHHFDTLSIVLYPNPHQDYATVSSVMYLSDVTCIACASCILQNNVLKILLFFSHMPS